MRSWNSIPLCLVGATLAVASPEHEFILAAMRLGEERSYHWRTTVVDDARSYDIEGWQLAGGYTWMRLPMVESVAMRLRWKTDDYVEAVFAGPSRCVIRTDLGWQSLAELPRRHRDWEEDERPPIPLRRVGNLLTREGPRPYSNAQFGLSRPHDELAIIVSCYHDLKVDGSVVSGILSNIGAQLLLVRDGQEHIQPVIAAARFKLWLENSRVTKYQLELEGVLLVNRQECLVRQNSITRIDGFGTTSRELPAVVRRKLGT